MAHTYLGHVIPDALAEIIAPEHSALIVVDMQNDFVHSDGYCSRQLGVDMVAGFQSVIQPIAALTAAARTIGVPVFYPRVVQMPDGSLASPVWIADGLRHGLEPLQCMRDTWGAEIIDELAPQAGDIVVDKTRRSAFQGTTLASMLSSRGVRTLVVVGVAGTGCVEATVRDAIERDYFVVVPADCTANNNEELSRSCRPAFEALVGERYTSSDVVIDEWNARGR